MDDSGALVPRAAGALQDEELHRIVCGCVSCVSGLGADAFVRCVHH